MKYVPELTGLRGLAAMLVFVSHAFGFVILPGFSFTSYGTQGVLLFFTLSGYLMGQLYLKQPFNSETLSGYCKSRIGRVFPLYIFIVIASYIISNYIYPDFRYDFSNPKKFLLALLFIKTPYELWTIPVEVHFYAVFILFWYLYSREKKNKLLLILVPVITFIPSILLFILKHKLLSVMPTFTFFFFGGVLIAVLQNKEWLNQKFSKVPLWAVWLIFILYLINLNGMRTILGITTTKPWHNLYAFALLFVFFALVIVKPKDLKILSLKPMLFLGEISFGFYLVHRPVINIINSYSTNSFLSVIYSLTISILIAYLLYRFLEKPARKFISKKTVL